MNALLIWAIRLHWRVRAGWVRDRSTEDDHMKRVLLRGAAIWMLAGTVLMVVTR